MMVERMLFHFSSFPRKREPRATGFTGCPWVPGFAGTTRRRLKGGMALKTVALAAILGLAAVAAHAADEEAPKRGGSLTYMIPADAPPSLTGTAKAPMRPCTRSRPF